MYDMELKVKWKDELKNVVNLSWKNFLKVLGYQESEAKKETTTFRLKNYFKI